MWKSKDSSKRLVSLIRELGKVAGYTIYTQRSVPSVYTESARAEGEHAESLPSALAAKY